MRQPNYAYSYTPSHPGSVNNNGRLTPTNDGIASVLEPTLNRPSLPLPNLPAGLSSDTLVPVYPMVTVAGETPPSTHHHAAATRWTPAGYPGWGAEHANGAPFYNHQSPFFFSRGIPLHPASYDPSATSHGPSVTTALSTATATAPPPPIGFPIAYYPQPMNPPGVPSGYSYYAAPADLNHTDPRTITTTTRGSSTTERIDYRLSSNEAMERDKEDFHHHHHLERHEQQQQQQQQRLNREHPHQRSRSALASAQFRQRRKQRELELKERCAEMEKRINELEEVSNRLNQEVQHWLTLAEKEKLRADKLEEEYSRLQQRLPPPTAGAASTTKSDLFDKPEPSKTRSSIEELVNAEDLAVVALPAKRG